MKKIGVMVSILAIVFLVILGAGCIASDSSEADTQTESVPATQEEPVPTTVPETNKVTVKDIAGTWYSTYPYIDGDIMALLKLEINPDGTGAETWYNNKDDTPYCYNTFKVAKLTNESADLGDKGMFDLIFDPPLSSNNWQITGNSEGLRSTLNISFSRSPDKGYWYDYKEVTSYPTPKISNEHDPADYIADGNYYLEDDNGRSFNATLWTGDITPYIEKYKSLPKMATGGSQAGNWVKYVRGLSHYHHAHESTESVLYQTIDETMNRGYGTCDDLAILAARGLKELGYNVSILVFPGHMDIGVAEEDYRYFHGFLSKGYYSTYHTVDNKFGDYYYLDITDYQHNLDIGDIVTDNGFTYDMTLKKIITL